MSNLNPINDLVVALTGKGFRQEDAFDEIIELAGDETYPLEHQTQVIQVLSGCAWVTLNGEDQVIRQGENLMIEHSREKIVISSLGSRPLVFEIQSV